MVAFGANPRGKCSAASAMAPGASTAGTVTAVRPWVTAPPSGVVAAPTIRTFLTGLVDPFCTITAMLLSTAALDATTATLPAGTGVSVGVTFPTGAGAALAAYDGAAMNMLPTSAAHAHATVTARLRPLINES